MRVPTDHCRNQSLFETKPMKLKLIAAACSTLIFVHTAQAQNLAKTASESGLTSKELLAEACRVDKQIDEITSELESKIDALTDLANAKSTYAIERFKEKLAEAKSNAMKDEDLDLANSIQKFTEAISVIKSDSSEKSSHGLKSDDATKLAQFEITGKEVLPMEIGCRPFSNREYAVSAIDGKIFQSQSFSIVQVQMRIPSPLNITVIQPGVVYAAVSFPRENSIPKNWHPTESVFGVDSGAMFRVYAVNVSKGNYSFDWVHEHAGVQILVPK
jgi:hypothetical protein